MSVSPLVSIITPFFNEEKFLNEAIESVFAQTYYNWELLLVDDGSTDKSTQIAKEFAQRHPDKIFYLEHEGHKNLGPSAARNVGIRHAHGEFITFLDGDDIYLPDKLKIQVSILEEQPVGVVVNPLYFWYPMTGTKQPQQFRAIQKIYSVGEWFPKMFSGDNWISTDGTMIRRDVLIDVGGFDESFRNIANDLVVWIKLSLNSSFYFHPECVALYRMHPESNTATFSNKSYLLAYVHLFSWLREYMKRYDERQFPSVSYPHMFAFELPIYLLQYLVDSKQSEIASAFVFCMEPLIPELVRESRWNDLKNRSSPPNFPEI